MFKRHFFLVAAIAVLVVMALAGGAKLAFGGFGGDGSGRHGGRHGGPGGAMGIEVTPTKVISRAFSDDIQALGVAKGRQSLTVAAPTTELVTRVLFHDGEHVKKGDVLIELQASEQSADVAASEAQLVEAQNAYQRTKTLSDRGFASKAALDQARSTLNAQRASVAAARARQGDRTIRAPFSGVVGLSDITPGALISPGTTIVTLDDLSAIRVDFDLPDRYLPAVSAGQEIVARPDAYPNEVFRGKIAKLDTRVNQQTRSITARAEFPNPDGRLKPGMLMRVSITRGLHDSLAAPETAVSIEGEEAFIYVLTKEDGRMVAKRRTVTTGLRQDSFVELTSGALAGEIIVANGLNRVQPGQPVKLAVAPGSQPEAASS